jgi:DNA-directed RNA polymerase specialized sigma24 family protein
MATARSKRLHFATRRLGFLVVLPPTQNMPDLSPESNAGSPRVFSTTHWSVVTAAGKGGSEPALCALETLCRVYWYPIYAYVRRKGYRPPEAQDLTQEFFAQLIAKEHLRLADRNKGKFRSFLLATLDYFLAREWSRAHRQKRGGQFTFISMDAQTPEERYRLEPADLETPEKKFLRQWTLTVLKQAMNALQSECEVNGKGRLFEEARNLLSGERGGAAYAQISQRLSMAEGAVRVAVHRLRQRYGELLRTEVAQTVASEDEVDEELRYLLRVLST